MASIRLRHLSRDVSRHGQVRWYVRIPGLPRVRIEGEPGTEAFMAAYHAALAGAPPPAATEARRAALPLEGTLAWLCDRYREGGAFRRLAPSTRRVRENVLRRLCEKSGRTAVARITAATVREGRERRADRPEAANEFVKTLRALFAWAVEVGHTVGNPAAEVRLIPATGSGFHTWSLDELARFEARFAPGTRERIACDLLLYTGLRISDAVRVGRQHVRRHADGTEAIYLPAMVMTGEPIVCPIIPGLRAALDTGPIGDLAFLVTAGGRPWSGPESFGNWFGAACRRAGVPGSAHGLRKLGAVVAAERGATEMQLMALYGWRSSKEAARYTKAASRVRLAREAAHLREPERAANARLSHPDPGATEAPKSSTKSASI